MQGQKWKSLLQAGDEVDSAAANDSDAQAAQQRGRRRARDGCLGAVLLLRRGGSAGPAGREPWPLAPGCCAPRRAAKPAAAPGAQEEVGALRARGLQDDSYAYVACMAVARRERRRGAASALLAAAERVAGKWAQNWVLLHVYCDNFPAQRLYHRNRCAPALPGPTCPGPLAPPLPACCTSADAHFRACMAQAGQVRSL